MSDSSNNQSRTEQATPRRLEEAQQKGQIAYSSDFSAAATLLIASIATAVFSDYFLNNLARSLQGFIQTISLIGKDNPDWAGLSIKFIVDFIGIAAPVTIVVTLALIGVAGLMTQFKISSKALKIDFEKIHPRNGFKRIFSLRSVMRGLTAVGKAAILVGVAIGFVYYRKADLTVGLTTMDEIIRVGWSFCTGLAVAISAALLLLAIFDLLFQKWKHLEDMKMSRQEVVDERKEDEGDPHIKARLRKLQREMGQRRMISDVRDASVVVRNPTHFAVALKYDRDTMDTPIVVAKGSDHLALKIISVAEENGVVVLERKQLARALFQTASIGESIPFELFQAVAEVIAHVYRLKRSA